jgi:phosphoenolpyruvate-protein kinase (PTS system EI component)
MGNKKSYMVAVQVTLRPVVYIEVEASSAGEAVSQVRGDVMQTVANSLEAYLDEVKTDFSDLEEKNVKVISCGRSDQYHSAAECELCASIEKGQ